MKQIRQLILGSMGVSALVLICAMTYRIQTQRAMAESDPPVTAVVTTTSLSPLPSSEAVRGYTLRIYGSGLGVFRDGDELPERVIPAELSLLTELDRQTLREGIRAEDPSQLQALLEDFTS